MGAGKLFVFWKIKVIEKMAKFYYKLSVFHRILLEQPPEL
jgi:hypothetical protein